MLPISLQATLKYAQVLLFLFVCKTCGILLILAALCSVQQLRIFNNRSISLLQIIQNANTTNNHH